MLVICCWFVHSVAMPDGGFLEDGIGTGFSMRLSVNTRYMMIFIGILDFLFFKNHFFLIFGFLI